jgi:hypothetical protein
MKLKVKMIIMSHLSDLQESLPIVSHSSVLDATVKLNFVKYLLLKHDDLTIEVDADKEFESFCVVKQIKV